LKGIHLNFHFNRVFILNMKIEEFKYLEKETKKRLLFDNGVYLASRQESEFIIELYQIDSFYVEAYFHESDQEIGYMRAFSSLDDLLPYLGKIDISNII
jgi:hypothetical protein